jgi:drug/metabolite transporter (DMT)-like permease
MNMAAPLIALAAAACFGSALIVAQFGFRHAAPLAGGTVSVLFTTALWWALSPAFLDLRGWHVEALAIFATVGLFYPALVTLVTFQSNVRLGPTLTSAVSCTAPLFAVLTAIVFLGERVSLPVAAGGAIVVAGLVILSARAPLRTPPGWRIALPLSGAVLRGIAQTLGKLGLALWPSPFAAALLGYTVSAAVMAGTSAAASGPHGLRMSRAGLLWFMAAGALNGSAVLLLYYALNAGSVAVVSPIVATYPLFTMLFSAIFLKTETLSPKAVIGVLLAIAGVAVIVTA